MKTYRCDIPGCGELDQKCVELTDTPRGLFAVLAIPLFGTIVAAAGASAAHSVHICPKHWKEILLAQRDERH